MDNSGRIITADRMASLHPKFQPVVNRLYQNLVLAHEAGRLKYRFEIFEGFRHFSRQRALVAKGVSKAGAWKSAHNFGLGADFVPYLTKDEAKMLARPAGWYWPEITDPCWKILADQAALAGAVHPMAWDGPHVEFVHFRDILKILD